jgi:polyphosphate kinase
MAKPQPFIPRDISWLSFNARVLQEAADPSVPLRERIRFLGIFSNNLDEFFRVRVATLKRMLLIKQGRFHKEHNPTAILDQIQHIVFQQQEVFDITWKKILRELKLEKIYLKTEKELNREQQKFVLQYFDEEVESSTTPLMIQGIKSFPVLREKSLYLAVSMQVIRHAGKKRYALIEIPTNAVSRFLILPSRPGEHHIMLLEDVIRFALPRIFSMFGATRFESHIIKLTRDAELDFDTDLNTTLIQKIEKGLKARKKAKPVRFLYDREIHPELLAYLVKRFNLTARDNLIPGGRIHNFRHFMDFPDKVFPQKNIRPKPFHHPLMNNSVTEVVLKRDVLLHFPYHSFDAVIDLLREAAMHPKVTEIKITAYRLASNSKVMNTLINAAKNGKKVTVMLELKARFEEEANIAWKERLEEEGIKVLIGVPNMKVHAKICLIKRKESTGFRQYGFISTGNVNEKTARVYSDCCLLTANRAIMADINRIFRFLENPGTNGQLLSACNTLLVSPVNMRQQLLALINNEIKNHRKKKPSGIILKLNSLSDPMLIRKLYEAAGSGVPVQLIIRSIFCIPLTGKGRKKVNAISIVDEYLEHSRILLFKNGGKEKVYISSADWMVRNLDHRVEAACPVTDEMMIQELNDYLHIQLNDNFKARLLDEHLENQYVASPAKRRIKSQQQLYHYLHQKTVPVVDK